MSRGVGTPNRGARRVCTSQNAPTRSPYSSLSSREADCGSAGDAVAAQEAGADLIGTTLVGNSGEQPKTEGPDWEAVDEMLAVVDRPLIVEGRLHTPDDAAEAMRRGPGPWWWATRSPTRPP